MPPKASDANRRPRASNANPNGVSPAEAVKVGEPTAPSSATGYVPMRLVFFSVTTSVRPSGERSIWAGPAPGALSGCVDPRIGTSLPSPLMSKPATPACSPALRT